MHVANREVGRTVEVHQRLVSWFGTSKLLSPGHQEAILLPVTTVVGGLVWLMPDSVEPGALVLLWNVGFEDMGLGKIAKIRNPKAFVLLGPLRVDAPVDERDLGAGLQAQGSVVEGRSDHEIYATYLVFVQHVRCKALRVDRVLRHEKVAHLVIKEVLLLIGALELRGHVADPHACLHRHLGVDL